MANHSLQFIEEDTNTFQFRTVIEYFKHKKNGTFIEMGAADGILGSNTYRLERDYGWDGILIEPIKDYFDDIPKYRKTSHILNVSVGETEGPVEFTRIEGYSKLLSGISEKHQSEHKDRINREVQQLNQKVHVDFVQCKKLITILNECKIFDIDYLSVDVEGAEFSVLKSLCMEDNKIRPILIGCENNYGEKDVEDYLKLFGYKKMCRSGADDFFELK